MAVYINIKPLGNTILTNVNKNKFNNMTLNTILSRDTMFHNVNIKHSSSSDDCNILIKVFTKPRCEPLIIYIPIILVNNLMAL